jgi:hypothetical protein
VEYIEYLWTLLWDWIPATGRAGVSYLDLNLIGLMLDRSQGSYILQHNLWDKLLEVKWNILNIYGAPPDENKEEFLNELATFC